MTSSWCSASRAQLLWPPGTSSTGTVTIKITISSHHVYTWYNVCFQGIKLHTWDLIVCIAFLLWENHICPVFKDVSQARNKINLYVFMQTNSNLCWNKLTVIWRIDHGASRLVAIVCTTIPVSCHFITDNSFEDQAPLDRRWKLSVAVL